MPRTAFVSFDRNKWGLTSRDPKFPFSTFLATTKVSQRMTVRQLESMIRLSEALAKLHCDTEVSSRYVLRAKKLLEDSIVGVESDSIDLEDDEDISQRASIVRPSDLENSMDVDDEAPNVRASGIAGTAEVAQPDRQKLAIDYEKYRKISNAIVTRLRTIEEEGKDVEKDGMTVSQVIDWYLETIEDELDSEEALLQERRIVSLVIKRLYQKVRWPRPQTGSAKLPSNLTLFVPQDHVLIKLRKVDSFAEEPTEEDGQDDGDPILVVHPNYVPEF